jgi:hypothetical protein
MLEFVLALKLLAQQPASADHVLRLQQNAQLQVRTMQVETPRVSPASGTMLSRKERLELRSACERFVEEQSGKLIDLREVR